jgi:hypothetical protein
MRTVSESSTDDTLSSESCQIQHTGWEVIEDANGLWNESTAAGPAAEGLDVACSADMQRVSDQALSSAYEDKSPFHQGYAAMAGCEDLCMGCKQSKDEVCSSRAWAL